MTIETINVVDVPSGLSFFPEMGIRHPSNLNRYLVESANRPAMQGDAIDGAEAERAYRLHGQPGAVKCRVREIIES